MYVYITLRARVVKPYSTSEASCPKSWPWPSSTRSAIFFGSQKDGVCHKEWGMHCWKMIFIYIYIYYKLVMLIKYDKMK